jgi:hypothetical protein
MDCRVTHRAPDYWISRLGALAPEKKEGRKLVVQLTTEHGGMESYVEILPEAKRAEKRLERFIKEVESVLKEMPEDRREELGYGEKDPRTEQIIELASQRQTAPSLRTLND